MSVQAGFTVFLRHICGLVHGVELSTVYVVKSSLNINTALGRFRPTKVVSLDFGVRIIFTTRHDPQMILLLSEYMSFLLIISLRTGIYKSPGARDEKNLCWQIFLRTVSCVYIILI